MSTHRSRPLPAGGRPWRLARPALHAAILLMATAAVLMPAQAPAHDWISPLAAAPQVAAAPAQPPGGWSGTLWPGVAHGAPAMPAAGDCRRAPAAFELPGYEPHGPRQVRPTAATGASAASGALSIVGRTAPAAEPAVSDALSARRDALAGAERRRAPLERAESMALSPERHVSAAPPPAPQPAPAAAARPADEPVSAGMVDDNADFGEYTAYRERWPRLARRELDITQRVLLDVRDAAGRVVPDAQVRVRAGGRELPLWARTDAGGRVWLMPQADAVPAAGGRLEVEVSKGGASTRLLWMPGQKDGLQARLDAGAGERARLDLVFLVDATGSMADEIDKLKRSMRAVADQIARLPTRPDICFGLVAYRDRGDEFFVRGADLTHDLGAFQGVLEGLRAGGGGDYPEALNEALHTAVHRISWRGEGTARMVVLVADAPPHLDYPGPQYDQDLRAAQARGIKVFSVGASGLNPQGEYVFRQFAQFTGGRFVFLTYAQAARPSSGPGRETVHDVRNYSVQTLDKLLVRLVSEEMARWPVLP